MRIFPFNLSPLVLGLLLVTGCQPETAQKSSSDASSQESSDKASAQKEATAWWKSDNQGAAKLETALAGQAKAGWASLPALDTALVSQGAKLFDSKGCVSCHSIGKGTLVGPDLRGVTYRIEPDWMLKWLKNPEPLLESDPYAKEMLAKYLVKMPNVNLSDAEASALQSFLRDADAKAKK